MKKSFANFIKLALGILILIFTEKYFFMLLSLLGINIVVASNITKSLINLLMYLLIAVMVSLIYKAEIKSAFSKFKRKTASNLLYCLIAFLVIFIVIVITNYICKSIANSFKLAYYGINYLSIFNKEFNLDLMLIIIKQILLIPFIYVVVFVLGSSLLFDGKLSIFFSGLFYASFVAFTNYSALGWGSIIINVIPRFLLFACLAYINKKNNNIAISIITYMIFILLSGFLITKIG